MGETNEAKNTNDLGQALYEAFGESELEVSPYKPPPWVEATNDIRLQWASVEQRVLDAWAPHIATLEAETRDLHSKLSIANVAVETERRGRIEAEHARDILSSEVGRAAAAAIVASVPAHNVKTQTTLNDAMARAERAELETYALRKKLEASEARAEKAEHDCEVAKREREEERQRKIDMTVECNAARRGRDEAIKTCTWLQKRVDEERALKESAIAGRNEARDEVARLTKAAEDAEDAVTGRLDAAFKDGASRMQAEIDRLKAKATARGQRSRYECVTPAGALYLDDPDANGVQFREAVRYAFASLTPRPDAGLAGLAERESSTVVLDASPTTPADAHPNAGGGPPRVEVELPKAERRPPFRDWTDADRAKLVPGASVMWHCLISACEPRTYGSPRRIVVREVCADDHPLSSGYVVIPDGPPDREVNLSGCDPATIEPPATQTQRKPQLRAWTVADKLRLKPGASVLWYCGGSSKAMRIVVRDVDNFGVDAEDEQGAFVSACFDNMDPETIVDAPSTPMLRPDLRAGDVVKDRNGLREWKITGVPEFAEWAQRWSVPVDDNGGTDYVWVEWLDLSTRLRFGAKTATPVAQAESVRPASPDLRKGDKIVAQRPGSTRADRGEVLAAPTWENGEWHAKMRGTDLDGEYTSTVPVAWLDLSTRERTWQRGEVVPHAPPGVSRQCTHADLVTGWMSKEHHATLPLAEPWTQKGV